MTGQPAKDRTFLDLFLFLAECGPSGGLRLSKQQVDELAAEIKTLRQAAQRSGCDAPAD